MKELTEEEKLKLREEMENDAITREVIYLLNK